MHKIIKFLDRLRGRTGIHLVDPDLNILYKDIKINHLPNVDDIIYFKDKNYEITRLLHNFENYRHTILIGVIPLTHKITADINITFDGDKSKEEE